MERFRRRIPESDAGTKRSTLLHLLLRCWPVPSCFFTPLLLLLLLRIAALFNRSIIPVRFPNSPPLATDAGGMGAGRFREESCFGSEMFSILSVLGESLG